MRAKNRRSTHYDGCVTGTGHQQHDNRESDAGDDAYAHRHHHDGNGAACDRHHNYYDDDTRTVAIGDGSFGSEVFPWRLSREDFLLYVSRRL